MSNLQPRRKTDFIVIHSAATKPTMDIGLKEITKWHRDQGYTAIGYHFVIRRDGTVETGRPVDTIGAHVRGYNSTSVGICMVGGIDAKGKPENNYTPEQFETLKTLIKELSTTYKGAKVVGHRDFPGVAKACPCFDAQAWWKENK